MKILSVLKSLLPLSVLSIFSLVPPQNLNQVFDAKLIQNIEWGESKWVNQFSRNWINAPASKTKEGLQVLKSGPVYRVGKIDFKSQITSHKTFGTNFSLQHLDFESAISCETVFQSFLSKIGEKPVVKLDRNANSSDQKLNEYKAYWTIGNTALDFNCIGIEEGSVSYSIVSMFYVDKLKHKGYKPYIYLNCQTPTFDKDLDFILDENSKNIYNEKMLRAGDVTMFNSKFVEFKLGDKFTVSINRVTGKFRLKNTSSRKRKFDVIGRCNVVDTTKSF